MRQTTNKIVMLRPNAFGFNQQTAVNNFFQQQDFRAIKDIQEQALREFDKVVFALKQENINVYTIQDYDIWHTPDSIFPNNWFVSLDKNKLFLCPMFANNRRLERQKFLGYVLEAIGSECLDIYNLSGFEKENKFLEGTGSMVLDRVNRVAFAAISPRCDEEILELFCKKYDFKSIAFTSYQSVDGKRLPIYHTNVMMSIGEQYAIVCLNSIDNETERKNVKKELENLNKEIIEIEENQLNHFAGNVLNIEDNNGNPLMVMSQSAYNILKKEQIEKLSERLKILALDISTIERIGGGSMRCMMAEIFA
ncbi:arginine deiminase-related protein [Helicobacter sp. 13S00477-4]|uniref:citrulline utilization hydrolase CtlX n=1 Tax=Helicobacter sp. 13S00477-4 TaxID=1905759 RepID=UPI000BCF7754|nr:arginine deiminase-related protein [Helicobacter sp. 13S00477-4]PAF51928.1 hypothetical protein BKH44_04500 [Helicobacter sp. 13S00477-4]